MNAQNAHEYLPVIQALANGKQIQHKNEHGEWVDVETIVCVAPQKLRIKPEPRTERERDAYENALVRIHKIASDQDDIWCDIEAIETISGKALDQVP